MRPIRYASSNEGPIPIFGLEAFEYMQKAGSLAAKTLAYLMQEVKPGITTLSLDTMAYEFIRAHHAIPAPLGYKGYPKSICTSINHVICHGIPDETRLAEGDIVNIDVTVILDGWYGDTSAMAPVGEVSLKAKRLMQATESALKQAIALARPGNTLGDIGHCIQSYVESFGYSVVREYGGHGIGRVFHGAPSVVHFGTPGKGVVLEPGMFLTIEPMVNAGKPFTRTLKDGWTVVTRDRSLSSQYEHTIGIIEDGCEVFTRQPEKS